MLRNPRGRKGRIAPHQARRLIIQRNQKAKGRAYLLVKMGRTMKRTKKDEAKAERTRRRTVPRPKSQAVSRSLYSGLHLLRTSKKKWMRILQTRRVTRRSDRRVRSQMRDARSRQNQVNLMRPLLLARSLSFSVQALMPRRRYASPVIIGSSSHSPSSAEETASTCQPVGRQDRHRIQG